MADFLNHLFLRSIGEQPVGAILQPRLPALFEPPDLDENSAFSKNPMHTEVASPRIDRLAHTSTNFEPPGSVTQPAFQKMQSNLYQFARPVGEPVLEEPDQTILPRERGEVAREVNTEKQAGSSISMEKHEDDLLPLHSHILPGTPPFTEIHSQPVMKPMIEKPHVQESIEAGMEPAIVKNKLAPVPLSQPAVTVYQPMGKQQLQQPIAQEPQQSVVEIHIGRIEVRAASPTPAPAKNVTPKTTTTSLGEYLRARSGGRR